jgi:hypothetical protein
MRKNAVFLPFSELFDDTENPLSVTNHRKLALIKGNVGFSHSIQLNKYVSMPSSNCK